MIDGWSPPFSMNFNIDVELPIPLYYKFADELVYKLQKLD